MQILGRDVTAIQYGNTPVMTAYVHGKAGDCRKETSSLYKCMDNCEGSLVIARFADSQPISIKALVPEEITIHPQLADVITPTLFGLEVAAEKPGYSFRDYNQGKVLYLHNQEVATYNPCGFSNQQELWSTEVTQTVAQLTERVYEVKAIAEQKPLEALLQDKALAAQLDNPVLLSGMAMAFGLEGAELVQKIKAMRG
jgi:hypothetical protein